MTDVYKDVENKLKSDGFFADTESIDKVRGDLHYTKLWADYIWRNRIKDESINDPTLSLIEQYSPKNILELVSHYGRYTAKVLSKINVNGIKYITSEVNTNFDSYFEEYSVKHPELKSVIKLDGKFNEHTSLQNNSFELILSPIYSISDLPYQAIIPTFKSIQEKLANDGIYIFSNYNIGEYEVDVKASQAYSQPQNFEIVGSKTDKILIETYNAMIRRNEHGLDIRKISSFNRLNNDYKLLEREFFFNQTNFISNRNMEKLISEAGFAILKQTRNEEFVGYVVSE